MIKNNIYTLSPQEQDNFQNSYFLKVFTGDEFPCKAFTENDWYFYPILWEDEYSNLQNTFSMAKELGEKSIYLYCPYVRDEESNVLELSFDASEYSILQLFQGIPYCALDYVLLGTKNEWGIYMGRGENYAILGCSPKVRGTVEKHYALFDEKFEGGEGLIDHFFEGAWRIKSYEGLMYIYSTLEKMKKDYPSMFSDIPSELV